MTTVPPEYSVANAIQCAVPCMNGHAGSAPPVGVERVDDLLGRRDRRVAEVPAAERAEEDVLGAPHHALGHAGGAAGVEDVEVVGGAGPEVACRRRRRERGLVLGRASASGGAPDSSSTIDERA